MLQLRRRLKIIMFFLILFASLLTSKAFCDCKEEFKEKIKGLKWVAYAPTNFDPTRDIYPLEDSLREDLSLLYKYGFRGLVTYGSLKTLGEIPRLAYEIGFSGMIMGVWDIFNRQEIMNAILASQYVDGYCIGNEGLNSRYDLDALNAVIENVKGSTDKPATTTEQIFDYSNDKIFSIGDWIFPNIHPFLSEVKDPKKGVKWIEKHYQILKKHSSGGRPILFKETGFPTSGVPKATQVNQKDFFLNLEKTDLHFVYFEAFDQFWKNDSAIEPHWGLFNAKRKPKKFISSMPLRE